MADYLKLKNALHDRHDKELKIKKFRERIKELENKIKILKKKIEKLAKNQEKNYIEIYTLNNDILNYYHIIFIHNQQIEQIKDEIYAKNN